MGRGAGFSVPINSRVKMFILNLPVAILLPASAHPFGCSDSLKDHLVKLGMSIAFDIISNMVLYC